MRVRVSRPLLSLAAVCCAALSSAPIARADIYLEAIPGSLDDTARIEAALDGCSFPAPACTVRLGPGTFWVGLIVAEEFNGAFVGAGRGLTIVEAMPNIPVSFSLLEPYGKANRMPNLVGFLGGTFTVADMSIRANEYHPMQGYTWLPGLATTYFLNALLTVSQKPGGTAPLVRVERVELSGADGDAGAFYGKPLPPGMGVNLNTPLFFGGFLFNPVVTGASFDARDVQLNRAITAFHTLRTEDSRITVTDAVVTASVTGLGAVLASNCHIRYEGNTVDAWQFGVDLAQPATLDPEGWVPSQPSRFAIARNILRVTQIMPGLAAGFRATDDFAGSPDGRRLEAWVANNDITVTGLPGMRFGIRLIGSEGARLVNNHIAGDGRGGVLVDYSRGCRIQSTSFEAFTPQGPVGSPVAHLLLAPNSGDCVAVTVPVSATVIDAGTNNVVRRTAQ
jgi:parallel beta-helix repeat protein